MSKTQDMKRQGRTWLVIVGMVDNVNSHHANDVWFLLALTQKEFEHVVNITLPEGIQIKDVPKDYEHTTLSESAMTTALPYFDSLVMEQDILLHAEKGIDGRERIEHIAGLLKRVGDAGTEQPALPSFIYSWIELSELPPVRD